MFDGENKNVALPKKEFAEYVLKREPNFDDFDFSAFRCSRQFGEDSSPLSRYKTPNTTPILCPNLANIFANELFTAILNDELETLSESSTFYHTRLRFITPVFGNHFGNILTS